MCTCANLARGESLYVQSDRIVWAHSDRSVTVWLYLAGPSRCACVVYVDLAICVEGDSESVTRSERGFRVELSRARGEYELA